MDTPPQAPTAGMGGAPQIAQPPPAMAHSIIWAHFCGGNHGPWGIPIEIVG